MYTEYQRSREPWILKHLHFGFCLFIYFQICGLTIEPRDTLDKCSVLELCATDPLSFYHFHNRQTRGCCLWGLRLYWRWHLSLFTISPSPKKALTRYLRISPVAVWFLGPRTSFYLFKNFTETRIVQSVLFVSNFMQPKNSEIHSFCNLQPSFISLCWLIFFFMMFCCFFSILMNNLVITISNHSQ